MQARGEADDPDRDRDAGHDHQLRHRRAAHPGAQAAREAPAGDGKYKDVTYEIEWKDFTSGPPLTTEMVAEKLDIGAMADFPGVLNGVAFQKQGSRSRFIATLSGSALGSGNGIVVPSDSPAQGLKDLKGKQISVPFGSSAHGMLLGRSAISAGTRTGT